MRRLTPVPAKQVPAGIRHPLIGAGPPQVVACTPADGRGVGGALSSGIDLGPISDLHPIASKPLTQTRAERPSTQETAAFIAFYDAYPRKKARPDALRAWVKQGCEPIAAEVMAGLAAHLPEYLSREPDKVPYPASWLRATEWKDPPLAPRARAVALPFAVAAEDSRKERATSNALDRLREELRPKVKPTDPRQEHRDILAAQAAGGTK